MPTLAARCSHCGTVFRVAQDQLRVAGGLVRCGRCGEAFNAAETLLDLEMLAPPASQHGGQATERDERRAAAAPSEPPAPDPDGLDFELEFAAPASTWEPPPVTPAPPPRLPLPEPSPEAAPLRTAAQAAPPQSEPDALRTAWQGVQGDTLREPTLEAQVEPVVPARLHSGLSPPSRQAAAMPEHLSASDEPVPRSASGPDGPEAQWRAEPELAPSFMRSAARRSIWQRPGVRLALGLACGVGLLLLAAQAAYTWRDRLAASTPVLRGPLEAACTALGCRIEAVRAIDSLVVDSSGLVRVERSDLYKLQLALHNRAAQPVAVPALDLTLSDASGRLLARRVLRAAELGVTEATLAAGRELSLQATLQARMPGGEVLSGYTIELFYP